MTSKIFTILLLTLFMLFELNASLPARLQYQKNQLLQYKLDANIDTNGQTVDGQKSRTATSKLNGWMLTKCVDIGKESYLFVMNLFDVTVDVSFGKSENSQALGYDMYYEQKFDGEIVKIWYAKADSPYFVNVKLSAIEAMQTRLATQGKVLEHDLVGVHYSEVSASQSSNDDEAVVQRVFSASDVQQFADQHVLPGDVKLQGRLLTTIDNEKAFIRSAVVEHSVTLIREGETLKSDSNDDVRGFNVLMGSQGKLNLMWQQRASLGDRFSQSHNSLLAVSNDDDYFTEGNLFRHASIFIHKNGIDDFGPEEPKDLIDQLIQSKASPNAKRQLIRALRASSVLFETEMRPFIQRFATLDMVQRDHLLYLLGSIDNEQAQQHVLSDRIFPHDKMHAIFILSRFSIPSQNVTNALWTEYEQAVKASDIELRDASVLAFGSAISRSEPESKQAGHELLRQRLHQLLEEEVQDVSHIIVMMYTIQNAETHADEQDVQKLLSHQDEQIRMIAAMNFKQEDPDYPYNQSFEKNFSIGGDVIGANFDAQLFAGTNFDCNHEYFNYKGLAQATADAHIFGNKKQFLVARALYAKKNGVQAGNQLLLQLFDKVLFNKELPTVDCSEHTYPIYHTTPGLRLSKTIWISIIPVTFSVESDVVIDLKWGWQICDSKLSAMVEFIPSATLVIRGAAEVNLLIIRGGVEVDASFNAALIPQARIEGTACKVALDLELRTVPMSAKFETFYQVKKCKFLIFDCKWQKKQEQVWWSWSLPSQQTILFKKEWPIVKP